MIDRVRNASVCCESVCEHVCLCLLEWRVKCGGGQRQAGDKSIGCMSDGCPISTDGENKGSTRGLAFTLSSMDVHRTLDGTLLVGL
jgi:hypothetical protein